MACCQICLFIALRTQSSCYQRIYPDACSHSHRDYEHLHREYVGYRCQRLLAYHRNEKTVYYIVKGLYEHRQYCRPRHVEDEPPDRHFTHLVRIVQIVHFVIAFHFEFLVFIFLLIYTYFLVTTKICLKYIRQISNLVSMLYTTILWYENQYLPSRNIRQAHGIRYTAPSGSACMLFIQPCFAFPAAVPHASVISPLTCRKACSGSILQNPDLRSVP